MSTGVLRRAGAVASSALEDHQDPESAAGDSITVAAWTVVSRVTGLLRFAVIGAVLGPTFLGNAYQFTNSLPNLIYFGFLAGSLFSSLLVPALVAHIDSGDGPASARVAGGFLGATLAALALVVPLAVVLGPQALRFAGTPGAAHTAEAQVRLSQWLILMFAPQVFFYGLIGTAMAVMNSRRRFALAAGAPAIENLGTIAVLVVTALLFGARSDVGTVPTGELLLLGLGSTGAVALHAAAQWAGALRAGVALVPRPGWRDPEVRAVGRRALPSLAQAGLLAAQVLLLLALANRVPGGVVAFQIGLNFYYLAIALGATPVALSLLPRLARLDLAGNLDAFRDTLVRGLGLGFFVTVPAAAGYLALAQPLARAISFGRMGSPGAVAMVAVSLAALSLAVVGQSAFLILTYASYARKDTRSPLLAMVVQATVCFGIASAALLVHGTAVLLVLGLALSVSICAAACHLSARLWPTLRRAGTQRLLPSLGRFVVAAVLMAGPAWLIATAVPYWLGREVGARVGVLAAALVGAAVFLALQAAWRTPELEWLAGGVGHLRARGAPAVVELGRG